MPIAIFSESCILHTEKANQGNLAGILSPLLVIIAYFVIV